MLLQRPQLEKMNIGDTVGVSPPHNGKFFVYPIGKIIKKTKTQVTVEFPRRDDTYTGRYMISTGKKVGNSDSWYSEHLVNWEFAKEHNEAIAPAKKHNESARRVVALADNVRAYPHKFTQEQLDTVIAALTVKDGK